MQKLTDEKLMLNYQKGDVLAMDEMLSRYKNPIFHFAYRFLGSTEEAQDVAQEVFFRLHQQKDLYRPIGKFSTWIFSIAHNLCISFIRKNKRFVLWPRKKDSQNELVDFPDSGPSPSEQVAQNELAKKVQLFINTLPFLQKEALILREYHDFSYEEISETMKKPLNTVKSLVHRARMGLKEKLLPFINGVERGRKC